jgi:hypothetical protein
VRDTTASRPLNLLVANLETGYLVDCPAVVTDLPGVLLWHELGCDADADTRRRRRLQIA